MFATAQSVTFRPAVVLPRDKAEGLREWLRGGAAARMQSDVIDTRRDGQAPGRAAMAIGVARSG